MRAFRAPTIGTVYAVRFVRPWQNFMPGDVAQFPPDTAKNLVATRRAEAVNVATTGYPPSDDGPWAMRTPGQVNKSPR